MAAKKYHDYEVQATIKTTIGLTIRATSLADAVDYGNTLGYDDFLKDKGDCMSAETKITGAFLID